jgi:hypothetical protein
MELITFLINLLRVKTMPIEVIVLITIIVAIIMLIINSVLTYETIQWIPFPPVKRFAICCLIWLLPVIGAVIAYQLLGFKTSKNDSGLGEAILGMDAIFNPQARHLIEYRQEKSAVHASDKKEIDPK